MNTYIENYIKTYESLNKWVKFLLNFLWTVPTNLYRLALSAKKKDALGMVIAAILVFSCGFFVLAVFDFITILFKDKVYWLDDISGYEGINIDSQDAPADEKKDGDADRID